jgi:hypothetical protein
VIDTANVRCFDELQLSKSAGVLLEIAKLFSLPTTLSVVPEGNKAPELICELRGSGFAQERLRASASPFCDEATKNLLAQSRRNVLVILRAYSNVTDSPTLRNQLENR